LHNNRDAINDIYKSSYVGSQQDSRQQSIRAKEAQISDYNERLRLLENFPSSILRYTGILKAATLSNIVKIKFTNTAMIRHLGRAVTSRALPLGLLHNIVTEPHLIEAVILKLIQMEQQAFTQEVLFIKAMGILNLNIKLNLQKALSHFFSVCYHNAII
jgi:hypothetical protein